MHEKVAKFFEQKKMQQDKEKNETLIQLGLYEKVYSPDNTLSDDYPYSDWEEDHAKYYNKVAVEVTEEEYKEIAKYAQKSQYSSTNFTAILLTAIACIIFIGGLIAGFVMACETVRYTTKTEFNFEIALTYWGICFAGGVIFLGFAEIIKLLDEIRRK